MNWDWEKLSERRGKSGPPVIDPGKLGEKLNDFNPKDVFDRLPGGGRLAVGLLVLVWLLSGIYIVEPDETGVVTRFGAFDRTTGPGPHYHIPFPVESAMTPKVSQVRRLEVGFRTVSNRESLNPNQFKSVPEEALMLTGDENLIDVQFIVQYQISDSVQFVFRIAKPDAAVKSAAEAAMREVIGKSTIDAALTTGKLEIQNQAKALLQQVLDRYRCGVIIQAVQLQDVHPPKEVVDAFKDVANAFEDKNRIINEAEAYANDILPRARGDAAAMVNDARAYAESIVAKAKGETARFTSVAEEFKKAPDVSSKRMYLEAMEAVLANPKVDKIVLSDEAAKNVLPFVPLDRREGSSRAQPGAGGGK